MKKWLIACLFVACSAQAQEGLNRDGGWWKKLPSQEVKWGYLVGFFDGMGLGHRFSRWGLEASEDHSDCVPHVSDSYRNHVRQYLAALDNQKLALELDAFYSEPKNKSIKVTDGVWIIANKLAGKPAADLDALIEEYRAR